jgi:endonuclease/exonuclease/phosphatase family metal-dependent hydrolase
MEPPMTTRFCALFFTISLFYVHVNHAETRFTVATFNLENYHLSLPSNRPIKSPEARAQVIESLLLLHPDVLALQELGTISDLKDLQSALQSKGIPLPHSEAVRGADTNLLLGILSRFPISARTPHTNRQFLLDGRRHRVSRGFAEVEITVTPAYRFTLINAHLKSKRPLADTDESELREQEAIQLRQIVEGRLARSPELNLVVCGDLNDTPDSRALRCIQGTGRRHLIDTRPRERWPGVVATTSEKPPHRPITWTHYYAKDETYSRLDYILLSPGMANEWRPGDAYVLATADWGIASDHRPVAVQFTLP